LAEGVHIRLLGPVGGAHATGAFDPGPPLQRAVLALLAMRAPHVVPISDLIDGLWGAQVPRSAEQSVYTYVAGLRRALEPLREPRRRSALLPGGQRGYQLRVAPDQVDARLFARRVEQARPLLERGEHHRALQLLEQALAMPYGPPLAGVPGPFAGSQRDRLDGLLLVAREHHGQALIAAGHPADAVEPLTDLVARHPLRERARELLMLAHHRCDRRAQALRIYEEGRRVLTEELGVDPGEGLRARHEQVLRGTDAADPAAPHVPRQLPRRLQGFVGREEELSRLRDLVASADPAPVAITGPPGVGKTALALQVSHAVKDSFPDGQVFVNLHGRTAGIRPLTALEALARFLRASGLSDRDVPTDLDEAAAVWRDRTDGRRLLVVLDDAADLAQIQPLIPAADGSALIVTSRETLAAGDDLVQVRLRRMPFAEASTVLSRLVGAERVAADPDAARKLTRLCDGLPLALRVAGARLADRPDWSVKELASRLLDERRRLGELRIGELAVQSALVASWTALRDSAHPRDRLAARLLRFLGVVHLPEVSPELAAALLDRPEAEAGGALDRLADAHLVDHLGGDRFHPHDLVRLFAAELSSPESAQVMIRTLEFCVATARRASVSMDPSRVQPPATAVPDVGPRFAGSVEAQAWLAREEANLMSAAARAMYEDDERAARLGAGLVFALLWFQSYRHRVGDMGRGNRLALEVAERLGDPVMACYAHMHLGAACSHSPRTPVEESARHFHSALDLARETGDRHARMQALGNLAHGHFFEGRYEESLSFASAQLAAAKEAGIHVGARYALIFTGASLHGLGHQEEALASLTEALELAERAGDIQHQASSLLYLGKIHIACGRPAEAITALSRAAEYNRSLGYPLGLAADLVNLSSAYRALGRLPEAFDRIEAAAAMSPLNHTRVENDLRKERALVYAALGLPPPENG
jgi:DNA-binding SARP family transcriptional activator/tetratricopeptide (TPR) repeat protein